MLRLVVLGMILMTAAGLGLVAYQAVQPPPQVAGVAQPVAPPPPRTAKFLTAARAIPAGTLIRDEDFRPVELEVASVPEGALQDTPDNRVQVRGALVRTYIDVRQPATMDLMLRPRDRGFLAAVLAPGTRAISIAVDSVSGVAGLLWPGDRVDVILVQEFSGDAKAGQRVVSEIIMADMRVIAVDQYIVQGAAAAEGTTGHTARVITLQVTDEEAQRIAVATRLGQLRLTIRAAEPPPVAVTAEAGAVFSRDVSPTLSHTSTVVGNRIRVIQGEAVGEVTFK